MYQDIKLGLGDMILEYEEPLQIPPADPFIDLDYSAIEYMVASSANAPPYIPISDYLEDVLWGDALGSTIHVTSFINANLPSPEEDDAIQCIKFLFNPDETLDFLLDLEQLD